MKKEGGLGALLQLHGLGQRIWLDNITRGLLSSGTLAHYIRDLSVTGLTSNPTIFERAIAGTADYDAAIRAWHDRGMPAEALFFELAIGDIVRAADAFRPVHDTSDGEDGWVSLEVSPLLADNTIATIEAARDLHARADRPNLFVKIPGTAAGMPAIEESIFCGVPVNVTLLFSAAHCNAAADAYMRGIERRLGAGLSPRVASVASLFVSRWDAAVAGEVQDGYRNRLGIAIAMRCYKAYRDLLASPRWLKLAAAGAQPQRLLWASTGTKDPAARDTLYIEALAAPGTINTIPEKTLLAFADHGRLDGVLPDDGGHAEAVIGEFNREGIDEDALAETLQREGAEAFVSSWRALMSRIGVRAADGAAAVSAG
jgi:transaldolase